MKYFLPVASIFAFAFVISLFLPYVKLTDSISGQVTDRISGLELIMGWILIFVLALNTVIAAASKSNAAAIVAFILHIVLGGATGFFLLVEIAFSGGFLDGPYADIDFGVYVGGALQGGFLVVLLIHMIKTVRKPKTIATREDILDEF